MSDGCGDDPGCGAERGAEGGAERGAEGSAEGGEKSGDILFAFLPRLATMIESEESLPSSLTATMAAGR